MTPKADNREKEPTVNTVVSAQGRPLAVLDIGTRAIRLDIAEQRPEGEIRVLESLQQAVRLGKETFGEGHIEPASIEECVELIRRFRQVMVQYGVTTPNQIRAVASSSIREADNKDALLDRIYIATGISVDLLDDAEVEHLIHLALHDLFEREPDLKQGNVLITEVGGGGTRLLLIQDGYVTYSGSFRLGTLRLREAMGTYQTADSRARTVLNQQIQRTLNQMRQSVPSVTVSCVIALAGDTATAMSRLLPGWKPDEPVRLPVSRRRSVVEEIVSMSPDRLMVRYQLPSQEAETAGQSLLIYDRIARAFGAKVVLVTAQSMRRGLLMKMAGNPAAAARFSEQLVHSAAMLGQKYRFDENHARQVADLSARLFRALQAEHGLGPHDEVLLKTAAILHDIGAFVSMTSHHKHSMYLIMNSEIFGLPRKDTLIVALVARYHRRATPRGSHAEYMALDRDSRITVAKLAALLRVADALDRSHLQSIRNVTFSRAERQFIITAAEVDDVMLERSALKEKADLFEDVFGLQIVLRASQTLKGTLLNG